MNSIESTLNRIKAICLNHKEIKSFNLGNTWDMAASKSSDVYPAVWCETPVLVEYQAKQKTLTFSLDILMLPKQDDVYDEFSKQSQCEEIADELLQAFKLYIANFNMGRMTGLTVKNINSDIACGVRVDVQFITGRQCDIQNNFNEKMIRE